MNRNKKKLLLSLGFKEREITSLKKYKNIEELIVLLSSLHIKNIKRYLLKNNYERGVRPEKYRLPRHR